MRRFLAVHTCTSSACVPVNEPTIHADLDKEVPLSIDEFARDIALDGFLQDKKEHEQLILDNFLLVQFDQEQAIVKDIQQREDDEDECCRSSDDDGYDGLNVFRNALTFSDTEPTLAQEILLDEQMVASTLHDMSVMDDYFNEMGQSYRKQSYDRHSFF